MLKLHGLVRLMGLHGKSQASPGQSRVIRGVKTMKLYQNLTGRGSVQKNRRAHQSLHLLCS